MTYKKLTSTTSEIYFNGELIGTIEMIGLMYSIEVRYMSFNLPKDHKRLIKGIISRLNKHYIQYNYKRYVHVYNLRQSKMYGKKYVAFEILD
jgi:hypothetical protein